MWLFGGSTFRSFSNGGSGSYAWKTVAMTTCIVERMTWGENNKLFVGRSRNNIAAKQFSFEIFTSGVLLN